MNRYHGLDWLAMFASLVAMWLIGGKRRSGFAVFAGANAVWLVVGVWAESAGIVIGNLAFLVSNVRGYLRWGRSTDSGGLQ